MLLTFKIQLNLSDEQQTIIDVMSNDGRMLYRAKQPYTGPPMGKSFLLTPNRTLLVEIRENIMNTKKFSRKALYEVFKKGSRGVPTQTI